jgi:DNA-binding CsgD family transcriptional regulator
MGDVQHGRGGGDALDSEVIGRPAETARLRACMDRALRSNGDAVVVSGEIGMGVTTMLDSLCAEATDCGLLVLRARGRASERSIDGAVLHELAAGDHGGQLAEALTASRLPTPQEVAAAIANDPRPRLLVVDDAHLADHVSVLALAYAAHRLTGASCAIVLGGRTGPALDTLGIERVTLRGIEITSLRPMLVRALEGTPGGSTAPPAPVMIASAVVTELHRRTGGNPLAAIEMARRLRPAELRGDEPLPSLLAPGGTIGEVFAAPLRALDTVTRRALCLAAAEPTGDLRTIGLALAALQDDVSGLEPAEEAGVIEIVDGAVRFDHPLRRAAAYHLLAAPSRRAAHRALALACDRPGDGERRAAHLDLGTLAPDEGVASDLERVARSVEQRGDRSRAARWWARAAELSPHAQDAERRRGHAGRLRAAPVQPLDVLTAAERRVAAAVGAGLANKEAAAALHVSVKTVDAHLQAIYRKLSIRSRTELALMVSRDGDGAGLDEVAG